MLAHVSQAAADRAMAAAQATRAESEAARESKLCLTRAVWNGAATGTGVFKLIAEGTKETGGFHVKHIS